MARTRWFFEPGHTAAEFRVRHMMVTEVRGHFKGVHGTLEVDPDDPRTASMDVVIDARAVWSGEPDRDAHLRSADFLDVDHHPTITFRGNQVDPLGDHDLVLTGDLTIRGVTRPVTLDVRYLGRWDTPWWEDGVDKGPKTRAGFVAETTINRLDFGVGWNSPLARGGVVVGNRVDITIDVEAVHES